MNKVEHSIYIATQQVSSERCDWLKQVDWLNARMTLQNSPAKFLSWRSINLTHAKAIIKLLQHAC